MIETLSSNGPDEPLDMGILPGLPWCRQDFAHAHRRCRQSVEGMVAVVEEESRTRVPRERFAQLLRDPRRAWITGDGDVHDASAIVRQNDQHEQER